MENETKNFYLNKINLTLPKKSSQKKLIKNDDKTKRKETSKNLEKTPNVSIKKKTSFQKVIKEINLKSDRNDLKEKTIKKINEKYYELINRINEDKKDLYNLNKMYDSLVLKIENNYQNNKIDNSKTKKKEPAKFNNNINYFNMKKNKKINDSSINDSNNNFIYINTEQNKDNILPSKIFDKNKIKKMSLKKVIPKFKNADIICKKTLNNYITVNQTNNLSKRNEKILNKTINNNIDSNRYINCKKFNIKKLEKNKNIFNLTNLENTINVDKKSNITPKQKIYFFNKDNSLCESNNNGIKLIKITDLNNNIQKNKSSSTINYSPENLYHNIRNNQQNDNYIKIDKYKRNKNENITNIKKNDNIIIENASNKQKNLFIKKNENINNNINKKRNLKNKIKIKDKFESKNRKKIDISLYSLERNTISYIFPGSNKNNNNIYKLNELFSRDNKNLTLQKDAHKPDNPFTKINISLNQNVHKNIESINERNYSINKEFQKNKSVKSINHHNDIDNKCINQNQNIYYNENKRYNMSIPKINAISDIYNKNLISNNHFKQSQSTISYTDFNITNLSSIKKSEKDINQIKRNQINSFSRRKLSISFNKEYICKEKNITQTNNYINNLNENKNINKDNFYFKKKNDSFFNNNKESKIKDNNKDNNFIKNNHNINFINSDEFIINFNSHTINQNDGFAYNDNTPNNIFLNKKLYIKPLKINSKSKNKNKINEENTNKKRIYKKKLSPNNLASKKYIINNSIESFNQKNKNIINYMKKPTIKLKKIKDENNDIDNKVLMKNNNYNNQDINQDNNMSIKVQDIPDYIECNKIDKNDICCFYQKLYNYFLKMPIKKLCYIEKVKKGNKNNIFKNKIKCYSSFNCNKNKIIEFDEVKFNGKNIISEKKERNYHNRIRQINGSDEFNNFELIKYEKNINLSPNAKDIIIKTDGNKSTNFDQKENNYFQLILDNDNNSIINNKNQLYNNFISQSTSKISNKYNINNNIAKSELPKNIKICLATNKLNNIFTTKNENEETKKNISLEKEKFVLGCSKLNNILHKKILNYNIDLWHSQKMSTKNNIDNNFIEKNVDEINKKIYTYNAKNKNRILGEERYKEEYKNVMKENQNNDMKKKIISLIDTIKTSNIKIISEKIVGIILFTKVKEKIIEVETIFVNCIFEKINKETKNLGIYIELCKNINYHLTNENKKEKNFNKEINLIDIIIKEFYEILNMNSINKMNAENENELECFQIKFVGLINFISELILHKLILKKESINFIQNLFNEYNKYENEMKCVILKGCLFLVDSLLKTNENIDIIEYFIENELKNTLKEKNILDNLKNKINIITKKYNENKNIIKESNHNKKNSINNDENGGMHMNIEDENIFEEVSFKADNKENIYKKKDIKNENCKENKNNIFQNNEIYNNGKNNVNEKNNISNYYNKKYYKSKKKTNSAPIQLEYENKEYEIIINEKDRIIYNKILEDFENYFEFLNKKGIKTKNDLYIDINYSYNWKIIDDLIMVKKIKLEEIIKVIIEICKNKKDIEKTDIFKINEYIKTIIEYYSNDLSNNQVNIFRLNMIEIYMTIDSIILNTHNSELMYEILGNLLFVLLKNKLYYIKDLNNFIDKSKDTQIKICKIVKYAIISSGNNAKQYINDFKYTKLFNNSEIFVNYVINELINKIRV